jgi:hypothetical protein
LLIASFDRLLKVDPGYRTAGVQTVSLTLPDSRYKSVAEIRAFLDRL